MKKIIIFVLLISSLFLGGCVASVGYYGGMGYGAGYYGNVGYGGPVMVPGAYGGHRHGYGSHGTTIQRPDGSGQPVGTYIHTH